jgi:hypothetical protein
MNPQAVGGMKPTVQSSEDACPWRQQDEACARFGVIGGVRKGGGRIANELWHSCRNQQLEPPAQPNFLRIAEDRSYGSARQHGQHRVGHVDRPDVAGASPDQVARAKARSRTELQDLGALHLAQEAVDRGHSSARTQAQGSREDSV